MRTKNSIKNVFASFFATVLSIFIGFVAQKIFIKTLGLDYLGLNGLFNNIISMLSISELGIGSAIIFHLYEPIVKNKKEEIQALMNFYRVSYRVISFIILILGFVVMPFIPKIVGETTITDNLYFIYLLFILDTVFSYCLTYKRSILYADQKNYYINFVHMGYTVFLNVFQIVLLFQTHNYYLYLIIKIIMRVLENLILNYIVNHRYSYLKEKNHEKLREDVKKDIIKKVKALAFHQVGSFLVLGTDNILISYFFGVVVVGLYSNYFMITNAINSVLSQVFKSVTSSIGNLIVTSDSKKTFETYERIHFFNLWIGIFCSTSLLCMLDSFITIWLGGDYLLERNVLIFIVISFYFMVMKKNITVFKEASGIVYEDRFIPLVESFVNIVCSIVFLKIFGLAGVFLGTILSSLVLHLYSYPVFVYKTLFKKELKTYYFGFIKDFILFLGLAFVTYFLVSVTKLDSIFLEFIKNGFLALLIPNVFFLFLFRKDENLKFYLSLFQRRKKHAS